MTDSPTTAELLDAVAAFLRDIAGPQLSGHDAFLARVAANAAAIARRESLYGADADEAHRVALNALLGEAHETAAQAQASACAAIRNGLLNVQTPGLLVEFERMAARRVRIEQPAYRSLAWVTD